MSEPALKMRVMSWLTSSGGSAMENDDAEPRHLLFLVAQDWALKEKALRNILMLASRANWQETGLMPEEVEHLIRFCKEARIEPNMLRDDPGPIPTELQWKEPKPRPEDSHRLCKSVFGGEYESPVWGRHSHPSTVADGTKGMERGR